MLKFESAFQVSQYFEIEEEAFLFIISKGQFRTIQSASFQLKALKNLGAMNTIL